MCPPPKKKINKKKEREKTPVEYYIFPLHVLESEAYLEQCLLEFCVSLYSAESFKNIFV